MQYDILPGAVWAVNTTIGNKSLTVAQLASLSNYSSEEVVVLSGADILVLDFDFGYRIDVEKLEYKCIAEGNSDLVVASGIEFYYRDEPFGEYVSLATIVTSSGVFCTDTSTVEFAPRYVRIKHNVSGLTTSGVVYGCKAYNDSSIVDFGVDGSKTSETIDVVRGADADIRTVAIYNSGELRATAYVNLEPTFSDLDDIISISTTSAGPWVKALDSGGLISDSTNFNYGQHNNTEVVSNTLRVASGQTSGYYTTKIVNKSSDYCRFVINKATTVSGSIKVDTADPYETIELRCNSLPPSPYMVYRTLIWGGDDDKLYYRDKWLVDGATKTTVRIPALTISQGEYYEISNYMLVCDQDTEFFAGFCNFTATAGRQGRVYLINNVAALPSTLAVNINGGAPASFAGYRVKPDTDGGVWVYFYCESYRSTDFVDATGYYLCYFDSDLTNVFKWWALSKEILDLSVDYTNKHVWYSKVEGEICRLRIDGTIDVVFGDDDYTDDLGGIELLDDGTILFVNDTSLYRLSAAGSILSSYTLSNVFTETVSQIEKDLTDSSAVWVMEGNYVGRFFISGANAGSYDFRIELFYPVYIEAVDDGVWVRCTDLDELSLSATAVMKYISKQSKEISYSRSQSYSASPCLYYQNYSNVNYSSKLPIPYDTTWTTLPWEKVSTAGYLGKEEDYYQIRVHMSRETADPSSDSPIISSIYRQDLVELSGVEPNNYQNIYVKTYVAAGSEVLSGDIDLKARWRVLAE